MCALLVLVLFAAPLRADDAAQAALQRVRAAEQTMRESQYAAAVAAERKSSAAKRALEAKADAEGTPFMIFGIMKGMAEGKASSSKARYDAARKEEAQATTAFVKDGAEYVQAEEAYRKATGSYYNESQYQSVREQIATALSGGSGEEEPVDPKAAQREAAKVQKALLNGNLTTAELGARGADLAKMGDSLVAQTLDSKYTPPAGGAAAYSPGAPRQEGALRTVGYGRAAPPPDALRDDKAILLRSPMQTSRNVSSGRFASAGGDRLSGGDSSGALRAAEAAIKEDPRNAKAWVLKATALNKLKRFKEAEEAARRAAELDKTDSQAWRELAWAQLHNGKASEAESSATRMIFLDPDNAEAYLLRALAYEDQGMRDKMLADLEKAAALDPRFRNHLLRARAGYKLFDPENSDTEDLLGALAPPPVHKSNPMTWLGAFFFLLAASAYGVRRLMPLYSAYLERKAGEKAAQRTARASPPRTQAAAPTPAEEKAVVAGKYRLDQVAGRGGMGRVWAAWDLSLDRQVAVKEMAPELTGDPALRGLYLKEARTLAALHHPNIVEIFEVVDQAPQVYLVFEWVSGKTLAQLLAEKGGLELATARAVLAPVCEALAEAHAKGVVHRDLKPANIMVTAEGRVKLMDFGIARALGGARAEEPASEDAGADPLKAARTRTVAGIPAYRPPDAEEGLVTPAFDVFSLGVCLYEALTGKLPFGPAGCPAGGAAWERVSAVRPGVPEALDDILARAFEPRAEKRLKDARAFKAALSRV